MGNNRQPRRPQNPATRVYDSQGPDGRVKGTPAQLHDRYKNAAREVQGNDRILAESLMQFADHYYRLSAEGQEQLNAERQRRDADGTQDDSQPREQADRENVEPAEAQAPSAPDHPDRGRGQDQVRAAPDGAVTEEQIPLLRQRGRPSTRAPRSPDSAADQRSAGESDVDTQAKPNGDDRPAPRRRGRPRKSETLVADGAAPEGPAPDDQAQPAPRRRGRPPKSAAPAETPVPDGEGQPAPRRRGRPRKTDTAPAPVDGDAVS